MSASGAIKRLMPLMDRVLVEKLSPAQKTTGGVLLPEQASSKTVEGNVLAVGPGKLSSDGTRLPMSTPVPWHWALPLFSARLCVASCNISAFTTLPHSFFTSYLARSHFLSCALYASRCLNPLTNVLMYFFYLPALILDGVQAFRRVIACFCLNLVGKK